MPAFPHPFVPPPAPDFTSLSAEPAPPEIFVADVPGWVFFPVPVENVTSLLNLTSALVGQPGRNTPLGRYVRHASAAFATCLALGLKVLDWCGEHGGAEAEVAATLLYRDLLEGLDGYRVLVEHGVTDAAVPLVRSIWEIELQLAWLLKENRETRGLAYCASSMYARIRALKATDRSTPQGQQLVATWNADQTSADVFPHRDTSVEVAKLESLLSNSKFAPVNAWFGQDRRRNKPWYAFNGGPQTIEDLTRRLNRGMSYELFYRPWSKAAHGQNALAGMLLSDAGTQYFRPLRDPQGLVDHNLHAINIFLGATNALLVALVPDRLPAFGALFELELRGPLLGVRSSAGFQTAAPP